MKKIFLILVVLVGCIEANAQKSYPMEILPNKTVQLKSGGDTLWVLNNLQMQESITDNMRLDKADSMFVIFQAEIKMFQKVISRKNNIIKKNRVNYTQQLELLNSYKEKAEKEDENILKGKKKNKIWTGIGFASGVVIAFIIQSIL